MKKLKNGDEPLTAQSVNEIRAGRARARLYTGFLNETTPHFSSTDFLPLCQEAEKKSNSSLANIHRLAEQLLELYSDK